MKTLAFLKIVFLVGVIAAGLLFGMHRAASAAGSGQIYVSPASTSVQNGSNVTVAVRINPGTPVDGVRFTLNFDPALLKYVSVDTSSSAFSAGIQQTATASSVSVARILLGSTVSTDSLIATVTLQGVADSGVSALSLTDSNASAAGTYTDPSLAGGSVTLTAKPSPTPTPTPTPTGGTGSGSTSTGSGGTKTTTGTSSGSHSSTSSGGNTTTTPVTQSGGEDGALDVQYTAVGFSLQTSTPTQIYIKYGVDKSLGLQTPLTTLSTTHSLSLDPNMIIPGQTYYYQVIVKDAAGKVTEAPVKTFSTKGYTVRFVITDRNGHKLSHAKVELHSIPMTVTTDAEGVATFENVSPGLHHLIYTAGKNQFSQAVTVNNSVETNSATGRQTAALQTVSVQFAATKPNASLLVSIGVAGLAALFVLYYVLRNRPRLNHGYTVQSAAAINPIATTSVPVASPPSTDDSGVTIDNAHGVGTPHPGSVITPVEQNQEEREK
jgi:hypothetical protein